MTGAHATDAAHAAAADAGQGPTDPYDRRAYDFALPAESIAQTPSAERGDARMLVLPGAGEAFERRARDLREVLVELAIDPLVVVNDSKVVPARARPVAADGKVFEILICAPTPTMGVGTRVSAWVRRGSRLRPGATLTLGEVLLCDRGRDPHDARARVFEVMQGDLAAALQAHGEVPLPPYIARAGGPDARDRVRYQTTWARHEGSVAAPTAGLHFDAASLSGLDTVCVTLHVGPGTFLPVEADDLRVHRVPSERATIDEDAANAIERARAQGRPILAIGTTTTRVLEAVASAHDGRVVAWDGPVDLVITPAHRFRCVDWLVTNFHLPCSSLLVLVCAFAGRSRVLDAYGHAIGAGFRFYSYGDCMLVGRGERGV